MVPSCSCPVVCVPMEGLLAINALAFTDPTTLQTTNLHQRSARPSFALRKARDTETIQNPWDSGHPINSSMPACRDPLHSGLCWTETINPFGIMPLTVRNDGCLIHSVQGYWEDILKHCLVLEDTARCRVPRNMAISIRRFSDLSGITFDERSIIHLGESQLRAEGEHNRARTRIIAAWDEIQSITFAYKHPQRDD